MTSYLLGIEWSDSAFRVACFRGSRSSFHLTRLERIEFPDIEQSAKVEIFKTWLHEKFPADASFEVILSIPESHIILKELDLPNVSEKELHEALQWELSDKSSVNILQSFIQYQTLEKTSKTIKVASMVMKNFEVAAYVSFFKQAGVKLVAIEPSSLSLGRILDVPKNPTVLVTLEKSEANLIFLNNAIPVFSTAINLPITETSAKIRRFSKESAAQLVSQLKRTINYWEVKETQRIGTIVIATEAVAFTGFKNVAAHSFTIPVTFATIKKEALAKSTKFASTLLAEYMVSIGAGDRFRQPETEHAVNFLPVEEIAVITKEIVRSVITRYSYRFAMISAIVSCVLLLFMGFLRFRQFTNAREISQTIRFVTNHPAQQYITEINKVNTLITRVQELTSRQEDLGLRLRYIGSVTPMKLQLNSIKMANATGQEWSIEGTGDRTDILAFYYKLQFTANAKTVSMPYSNFNKEKGASFKISIIW